MKKLTIVLRDECSNTILFCNQKNQKLYVAFSDGKGNFDSVSGVYDGEGNHVLYSMKLDAFDPSQHSLRMLFKLVIDSKKRKYFYNLKNKNFFVFNGKTLKKVKMLNVKNKRKFSISMA